MEQFPKNEQTRTNSANLCCEKCLALPQRVFKKSSYIDHRGTPHRLCACGKLRSYLIMLSLLRKQKSLLWTGKDYYIVLGGRLTGYLTNAASFILAATPARTGIVATCLGKGLHIRGPHQGHQLLQRLPGPPQGCQL